MNNKNYERYLSGDSGDVLNEISSAAIKSTAVDLAKGLAGTGLAALGAAAATHAAGEVKKKQAEKAFKDTYTGKDLLGRLERAIDSLKELKAKKDEMSEKAFKERAIKLEDRIVKLKRQVEKKQREYRF